MEHEAVLHKVFTAKPELKNTIATWGNMPISGYLQSLYKIPETLSIPKERKERLLTTFEGIVRSRLGETLAKQARQKLEEVYMASTADHHGVLCHPFFSHMFLAQAEAVKNSPNPSVIVLPCGTVSMDNSSFPRGFFFHDQLLKTHRFPLLSLKYRHHSVLHAPPYGKSTLQKERDRIAGLALSEKVKERLYQLIDQVFSDSEILSLLSYDDQATLANYRLAPHIPGLESIHLFYIPQETLAATLLQDLLLSDVFFKQLFADKHVREALGASFNTVTGAHDMTKKSGTFFFWGVTNGNRTQLFEKDGSLVTIDGAPYVPLTNDSLIEALSEKRLIPNMALTFITLSFYHGLVCAGGFSQINYLGEMKAAYQAFLKAIGNDQESDTARSIPTSIFMGEIVALTAGKKDVTEAATLFDYILYGQNNLPFSSLTLEEGILRMMPEYYKIITGRYPKDNFISNVRPNLKIV